MFISVYIKYAALCCTQVFEYLEFSPELAGPGDAAEHETNGEEQMPNGTSNATVQELKALLLLPHIRVSRTSML